MTSAKLQKGQLLIAEPSIIGDISFNRTVILLADFNPQGGVGFILNKPLKYTVNDLLPDVFVDYRVYNGGPVEQDNLYFIHTEPNLIPNSIEIADGIFWGGNFEITKKLLNLGQINYKNIRFFLGYTGWETQQLENEIAGKAWVITPNEHKNDLLEQPTSNFWKEKLNQLGGEYLIWSNSPENPALN